MCLKCGEDKFCNLLKLTTPSRIIVTSSASLAQTDEVVVVLINLYLKIAPMFNIASKGSRKKKAFLIRSRDDA